MHTLVRESYGSSNLAKENSLVRLVDNGDKWGVRQALAVAPKAMERDGALTMYYRRIHVNTRRRGVPGLVASLARAGCSH